MTKPLLESQNSRVFLPSRNGASSPTHSPVAAISRESEAVNPKLRVERIPKSLFMSSIKSETKLERKEKKKGPSPIPESRNGESPIRVIPESLDLTHQTEIPSFGSKSMERPVRAEREKNEEEEEEEEEEQKKKKKKKQDDDSNAMTSPPMPKKTPNEEVLKLKEKFEQIKRVDQSEKSKDRPVSKKTPMERTPPLAKSWESHWTDPNEKPVKANPEVVEEPVLAADPKEDKEVSHDVEVDSGDASPMETFQFEASQPSKLTIGRNTTFDLDNLLNDVDFETELMELAPSLDTITEEASQTAEKEEAGDDLVDASEMWECEVVYDYQAETEQSISVYAGQHVWGVVESGDWTQIRTEDGRVDLDSMAYL